MESDATAKTSGRNTRPTRARVNQQQQQQQTLAANERDRTPLRLFKIVNLTGRKEGSSQALRPERF